MVRADPQPKSARRQPLGVATQVRGNATIRQAFSLFAASVAILAETLQQAELGRIAYQAKCSNCHATDMGGNEGPQLAGSNFMAAWGTRTIGDLVKYIQTTMPPGNATLGEEDSLNLTAFILAANGAAPGNQALTAAANIRIRSIATGRPAISIQPNGRTAAKGLTVSGEVKNYIPVSDE